MPCTGRGRPDHLQALLTIRAIKNEKGNEKMEKIKKNPITMAVLGAVGYLAIVALLFFIISLFRKDKTFVETISDPLMIVVFAVGTVVSAVQGYNKAKKQLKGEEKK